MKTTAHSEYGILQKVYLKSARNSFVDQLQLSQQWKELNYLSEPDFNKALEEYDVLRTEIESCGSEILEFSGNQDVMIDSIYCRDATIATDFGWIICRMGKSGRRIEPSSCRQDLVKNGEKILGEIKAPGTVEGGDVAWLDEKTLAIGRTYRTNEEGIEQIRSFLKPLGIEIIRVDLPHYKGDSDVFHLMSIFSPVDRDLAVIYSPLMPIFFRELLLDKGFQLVEVPDEEFESMGCNVLALAPRKCLMVKGNPITGKRLIEAGAELIEYSGEEISVKGGGGPTCLTRPVARVGEKF